VSDGDSAMMTMSPKLRNMWTNSVANTEVPGVQLKRISKIRARSGVFADTRALRNQSTRDFSDGRGVRTGSKKILACRSRATLRKGLI
jgi:hypothetical protein